MAIIVVITQRRDDYEENSSIGISGSGGGNVCCPGIRRWMQHVREAVCYAVREAVPGTGTLCSVRSTVWYVPVAVQLDLRLVRSMPEPVPEPVPEAVQHL